MKQISGHALKRMKSKHTVPSDAACGLAGRLLVIAMVNSELNGIITTLHSPSDVTLSLLPDAVYCCDESRSGLENMCEIKRRELRIDTFALLVGQTGAQVKCLNL